MGTWKALITTIAFAGVGAIFGLMIFENLDRQSILPEEPLFQVQNNTFETQSLTSEVGLCNDTRDNDGDGDTDCSDADCLDDPICETCLYSTRRDADTIRLAQGESYAICYCGDGIVQTKHGEQCENDSQCDEGSSCTNCGCIENDTNTKPIALSIVSNSKPLRGGDSIVYKISLTNRSNIPQNNVRIESTLSDYFRFTKSMPSPSDDNAKLSRSRDTLNPGQTENIEVLLTLNQNNELSLGDNVTFCIADTNANTEQQTCRRVPYLE